jgi:hypothetical protein
MWSVPVPHAAIATDVGEAPTGISANMQFEGGNHGEFRP